MLVPIRAFHAHPFCAVAACHGGNILAAFQAEAAIVADSHALGAMLLAVRANFSTVGASAAIGTNLHAVAAQIAVETESVRTAAAHFAAALANCFVLAACFAIRAVKPVGNRTFHTKVMRGANIRTVGANTAFFAVFLAAVAVASLALGAVKPFFNRTFLTNNFPHFFGAIIANGRTIVAPFACFTP